MRNLLDACSKSPLGLTPTNVRFPQESKNLAFDVLRHQQPAEQPMVTIGTNSGISLVAGKCKNIAIFSKSHKHNATSSIVRAVRRPKFGISEVAYGRQTRRGRHPVEPIVKMLQADQDPPGKFRQRVGSRLRSVSPAIRSIYG